MEAGEWCRAPLMVFGVVTLRRRDSQWLRTTRRLGQVLAARRHVEGPAVGLCVEQSGASGEAV